MHEFIERYFALFRNEQIILITLGSIAFITALVFYIGLKKPWFKGFALPLAVFAMLFCGAGINNFKKEPALRVRAAYNADMHPELLKTKELTRMHDQERNLRVLIYVNLSIIAASFFIFFYFRRKQGNQYYMGSAASLFLMATISVIMYSIMLGHAKNYSKGIENHTDGLFMKKAECSNSYKGHFS